jgi:hypothetical protein
MARLPPEPVSPRIFLEDVVPAFFAEVEIGPAERAAELKLGVCLRGEGGGEWTLHFVEGELGIVEGRASDCAITLVQSVEDWRSALWEGHPGLVADVVRRVAAAGPTGLVPRPTSTPPRHVSALEEIRDLRGLIEGIVASEGGPDWRLGLLIGPGPIPEVAHATLRIGAAQAEALRRGELHPLEALITGALRLEGDLGLILQLQALAMTASMASSRSPERS